MAFTHFRERPERLTNLTRIGPNGPSVYRKPVLTASTDSADEGQTVTFTITVFHGDVIGTKIPYTISGTNIEQCDLTCGFLIGRMEVYSNQVAAHEIKIRKDYKTEGLEMLTFSAAGENVSVFINDTTTDVNALQMDYDKFKMFPDCPPKTCFPIILLLQESGDILLHEGI